MLDQISDTTGACAQILALMLEFQARYANPRMCDGELEPWAPAMIYRIIFEPPLSERAGISPLEVFGSIQQCMHSSDGCYVHANFAKPYRVTVERPGAEFSLVVAALKKIKELALKDGVWVASITSNGDLAALRSIPPAGILAPNPGVIRFVKFDAFVSAIEEAGGGEHVGDVAVFEFEAPDLVIAAAARGAVINVTDDGSDDSECKSCGRAMVLKQATIMEAGDMWWCAQCDAWSPTRAQLAEAAEEATAWTPEGSRKDKFDAIAASVFELVRERHS